MNVEENLIILRDQAIQALPAFVTGVVLFIIFWLISKVARGVIKRVGRGANIAPEVTDLVSDVVSLVILAFGLVTALGQMGINVTAMVAGLGLTGFALGFALHDIVANTLAGILILLYHPFKVGDFIKVSDKEGLVATIDLRYTTLQNEGIFILVPNQTLFKESIIVNDPDGLPDDAVAIDQDGDAVNRDSNQDGNQDGSANASNANTASTQVIIREPEMKQA